MKYSKRLIGLYGLLFVSVLAVVYYVLTKGQTLIYSDAAIAYRFGESIKNNNSLYPSTFCFQNGEIFWSVTQLFELITTSIISDLSLAREMASLLTLLVMGVVFVYCSMILRCKEIFLIALPIILVYLQSQRNYMLSEACYSAIYVILLFEISLFVSLFDYELEKKTYLIRLIVFGFVLCIFTFNGIRYVSEITVPFVLGWALYYLYDYFILEKKRHPSKRFLVIGGVTIISSILGYSVYLWLCTWHVMNPTQTTTIYFAEDTEELWYNIGMYFRTFFDCFTYDGSVKVFSLQGISNLVCMSMAVLLCFVCPILQGLKLKDETNTIRAFYIISFFHNLVIFVVQMVSGLIVIPIDARYLMTSVALLVLISSRYIYMYWIRNIRFMGNILLVLFAMSTIIMSLNLINRSSDWKENLNNEKTFANYLLQTGAKKGYGSYLNAYVQEIYSDGELEMGAIKFLDDKIAIYTNTVDSSTYIDSGDNTFLLLTSEENEKYRDLMLQTLGEPIKSFYMEDVYLPVQTDSVYIDYYIYLYDHDIIQNIADFFIDGELTVKDMMYNGACALNEDGDKITITNGGIVHGPYCSIEKGIYEVTFVGDNIQYSDCYAYSESHPDSYSYELEEKEDGNMKFELNIGDYIDDIQFYTINQTDNDVVWEKVIVNKIK